MRISKQGSCALALALWGVACTGVIAEPPGMPAGGRSASEPSPVAEGSGTLLDNCLIYTTSCTSWGKAHTFTDSNLVSGGLTAFGA